MKKLISLLLIFSTLFCLSSITVNAEEIVDTKYSILKTLEIMVGDKNGNMRLDDNITRSEFTKIASTMSSFRKSIPLTQKASPFSDVPYKHWAAPYIKAAVDNGLVSGYPDSTFKPDNNVKYEEALTILLKLLGYTDADFGDSYPYGQYALANSTELTKGVNAELFKEITRRQVADLLINALNTKIKNNTQTLLINFDATKIDDVVILSSNKEDSSIPTNKISTTAGLYEFKTDITNYVGLKGDLILNENKQILYFSPDTENSTNIDKYVVYSTVSDGVIVYKDKTFSQIKIEDNTPMYINNNQTVFSAVKQGLTLGDTMYIKKNFNNEIDYINVYKGNLEGPYIYSSINELLQKVSNIDEYIILKNGSIINSSELETYDVYYYSKDLKILMVYNTKITGVYTEAIPNQEIPVSVTISGKSYEIESGDAFKMLSSSGKYKYGDTLTILLGKDKKIAGVINTNTIQSKNVGYILDAGIKNYINDTDTNVSQYYISVVMPSGENIEYKTKKDYSSYVNSISEIKFDGELATLNKLNINNRYSDLSGKFNYESLSLGKMSVSKYVDILDVSTTDNNSIALYTTVKPQRLDGVNLSSSKILYYETNEKNAITKLIIEDVTGDYYNYGVVTKVDKNDEMLMGSYKFVIKGTEQAYQTQNLIFGVNKGPARFKINGNAITSMQNITAINSKITELTNSYISTSSNNYLLAENLEVYYRNHDFDYMLIDLNDVISKNSEYKIQGAYYDKQQSSGGRVRIIIVTK